ncbi:MAG: Omp28-related outer membrane protein [Bacteroidota bacterium]
MKRTIVSVILGALLIGCDKVEQPYENPVSSEIDQSLYPGDWATYPWPVFTANTNTDQNILIEDYTGHTCVFCPAAADIARALEEANPGRVFVASIHASPGGLGDFQKLEPPTFVHDFTTPQGLKYGETFANGFGFNGNPRGTINRKVMNGSMFQAANNWTNGVNTTLAENILQVNLQAKVNYYPETRGLFVHTEIDTMLVDASKINLVVYLIEESFVSPQKKPGETDYEYHHHNVHRGNIDGLAFGRTLTNEYLKDSGKHQVDISYKLPDQYAADNCHLLIYAMNPDTYEIYQVIEADIQ